MADPPVSWPPRSPLEALLSSPSGRRRLRQLQDRTSPSPSTSRKGTLTPSSKHRAMRQLHGQDGLAEQDEEEDEETLQLQLEAIEAKLKLKKLRQAKAKGSASSDVENDGNRGVASRPLSTAATRAEKRQLPPSAGRLQRARSQPDVKVPLSPPPRRTVPEVPRSPGRVLLGIDKGLKGRDVSLRRPPTLRGSASTSHMIPRAPSPQKTTHASNYSSLRIPRPADDADRPKTFSERMADGRADERSRKEREEMMKKARSKGFGMDEGELERLKQASAASQAGEDDPFMAEARNKSSEPREFSRDEVLRSYNRPAGGTSRAMVKRGNSQRPESRSTIGSVSSAVSTIRSNGSTSSRSSSSTVEHRPPPEREQEHKKADAPSEFDAYSGQHLSKRILPHKLLTRTFTDKTTLLIPDLLKTVKSPNYDPPEIDTADFVVLAIVASKSSPKAHKEERKASGESGRGKYMALTLTDLKWEVDLFLFDTAFDRWWKLTPGTVVAILNPAIMPPPHRLRDTGKFSLTLSSSDDTILEVGRARDLGFCASIKKDGRPCDSWIDARHTEHCAFHVDASLRKTKAGRMEVNTMTAPFGPGGAKGGSRAGMFGPRSRGQNNGLRPEGAMHDRATQSQYFMAPGSGSAARLLDAADDGGHTTSKEERLRRRLAEREREREIARRLGETGNGTGSAYLGAPFASASEAGVSDGAGGALPPVDAQSLGLARSGEVVHLSPVKRKRGGHGGAGEAVGWSGALRVGRDKEKEKKEAEEVEPARKKTRFVTERGIREAGRDSLGGLVVSRNQAKEEDDDGLDIV
ncbi:MAG: hypothetical protein M1832_000952 [Thelocarpon impressellum]|nr:MAG: hypothetical protein M1832_000952 [Thelocarpon impressellum]